MKTNDTVLKAGESPAAVLGVSEDATDDEIREAYLRGVKEHPPERDAEIFERVRDAYRVLRDPRNRIRHSILSADPEAPVASVLRDCRPRRRFAGPEPWLAVLKEE
jgi:DnaJ-domain-containing protein 1